MVSPNKHIVEELDRFHKLPGRAYYGLQINAPWGAGKTYFIRSYLEKVAPSTPSVDSPTNLYITFFGAQSVEDLERQVVAQLFSKAEQAAGRIVSTIATGLAGIFQFETAAEGVKNTSLGIAINQRLQSVRGGLVVFDDIERTRIPMKDALGYVNRFVEGEGFKVILISNEEALSRSEASDEERTSYTALRTFREKLIGRTMALKADPESAYPAFVEQMISNDARKLASDEIVAALHLFNASGRENLRSMRIGLEAFDRVVSVLDKNVLEKKDALREVLLSCLYIAIELAATVDENVVIDPRSGRTSRLLGLGNTNARQPSEREKQADDIVKRYDSLLNLRTPVVPLPYLAQLVAHGVLLTDDINAAARISPLVADPAAIPPWRRLIEIWDLDQGSLLSETSRALHAFEALEVVDPGELLHLAGIMLWRASKGDFTLSNDKHPVDFVEEYLARLHKSGRGLDPKFGVFALDRLSAYGFLALGADDNRKDMIKISQAIRQSMYESAKARFPAIRAQLLEYLTSPDRDFDDLKHGKGDLPTYSKMPLFAETDPGDLAALIMRDGKFDHSLLQWLVERYGTPQQAATLIAEAKWLRKLRAELMKKISEAPPPLNVFWREIADHPLKGALAAVTSAGTATSASRASSKKTVTSPASRTGKKKG